MRKLLFTIIAILTIGILSCKKDNPTLSNSTTTDNREKYFGNYKVTEKVTIPDKPAYSESDTFVGKIEHFSAPDLITHPAFDSSSLYLYLNQATRSKLWSTESVKAYFIYTLIGTDSLRFDIQATIGETGGKIYGNNDSIIVNFWYGAYDLYHVTQKWIKM